MEKQVIHLYGASGAGISTVGKFISRKTGLFFIDTDDYFWLPTDPPYTVKRPAEERVALIKSDIEKHAGAVISGSLEGWGDELIESFTLAVYVETAASVRLDRIKRREKARFGSRIEKGGDMYEIHLKFLEWAAAYDTGGLEIRSRAKHAEWEKRLKCRRVTVDGALPPERIFDEIKPYLER